MYRLQNSSDCLVQSCTSDLARHGFVISHAGTSGNVFLQCDDRETGRALGSSSTPYTTGGSGSDNHMHFSHSNLWDSCNAFNSFYTAHHRTTSGTVPHGLTSAHGVYWNTTGGGTRYTNIVVSEQGRYGYVIGTSGSKSGISTPAGTTNSTGVASLRIVAFEDNLYSALNNAGRLAEWSTISPSGGTTNERYATPNNAASTQDTETSRQGSNRPGSLTTHAPAPVIIAKRLPAQTPGSA